MTQNTKTIALERSLSELVRGLDVHRTVNRADPAVSMLAQDSRNVRPGALFVAMEGEHADGHAYIGQAAARGAVAVVCERMPEETPACPVVCVPDARRALSRLADAFYGHPSRDLYVTGITGTDGKTSTTQLLRAILKQADRPAGTIGTLGYSLGDLQFDTDLTTPEAVPLHEALNLMRNAGLTDVCMEVSSHSLVLQRVADVRFDAAVLTNIMHDHLDYHHTREEYARAKRMLFEALPRDAVAVLPSDFDLCDQFRRATEAEVLTYSTGYLADVRGRIVRMGMDGMLLSVRTPFETYEVQTPLIGTYNCLNILAAATLAFAFGIDVEVVQEAMGEFEGVPGRLERVQVPGRDDLPAVCVDYAHTPGALEKVLTTLRPLVKGKLVCLVGCGGDRDTSKRPIMARAATDRADVSVFTADNSRSERTEDIIDQMVAGVESELTEYHTEPDRRRAIELAISLAHTPDSMVVLCGRGCERFQKMGDQLIPFDDRAVAREIMQSMPLRQRKIA